MAGVGSMEVPTAWNSSTLAATMAPACAASAGTSSARKPPRMAWKMVRMESWDSAGSQIMWKRRVRRVVTSWRPPPGGAQAAEKTVSATFLKKSLARS